VAEFPAISSKCSKVLDRWGFFTYRAVANVYSVTPFRLPRMNRVFIQTLQPATVHPTRMDGRHRQWEEVESACKPGSVRLAARQSFLSARRHRLAPATYPGTTRAALSFPYSVLLRVGFTVPRDVVPARGALLPHRFTLTCARHSEEMPGHRRFAFCCTGRQLALPRRYLAPCPMEPGLSSMRLRATRLSGRLRRRLYRPGPGESWQKCGNRDRSRAIDAERGPLLTPRRAPCAARR
jgi:hypothetical protein